MTSWLTQARWHRLLSLRVPVPLLVFSVYSVLFSLYILHRDTQLAEDRVEERTLERVTREMTQVQGTLEYLLLSGQLGAVRAEVAALGSDPDRRVGLLLDDQQNVLASTRLALLGRPMQEAWPELALPEHAERIRWTRKHMTGVVRVSGDGQQVVGYYPVFLGASQHEGRVGLIFLQQELTARKAASRRAVEQAVARLSLLLVLIAGMMGLFFFVLGRRAQRLVVAARKLTGGELRARAGLSGEDELGTLSRAFDEMAEEIGRSRLQLEENQERIRLLLDATAEAIIGLDLEGRCTFCNPAALQLLGHERAERLRGRPLHELIHRAPGEPSQAAGCQVCTSFQGVESLHGDDEVLQRADGREVPVEYWSHCMRRGGEPVGFVITFVDIGERKRAELALRRSEESFRTLIERSPEAIVIHREGRLLFINPAAASLLGYASAQELQGRLLAELVLSGEEAFATESSGAGAPSEVQWLHRAGRQVLGEMVTFPLVFDGQRAVVSIVRDITERKHLQEKLRTTERMVSLGTLAAGLAHEINNPLAYMLGNLRFIGDELQALRQSGEGLVGERWREIEQAVGESLAGGDRVGTIVRDLRTFSRGDDEQRGPVNLHAVLDSCTNIAQAEIRHRARLVKEYGELPPLQASESRLGQLFLNLLVNAAQAIPEGDSRANEIRITTARDEAGWVVVAVRDTGIGIPSENLHRLFDPFFTTKPIGVGTGLGLSICHGIIMALGGRITVESQPGAGSTFRVFLPVNAAPALV